MQLALTAARTDQRNFGLWLKNWQVGQTLSALVAGQRASGELVLRVGGLQITATADIPVQQGARLLLEVRQLYPQPVLRIIGAPTGSSATEASGTLRLLAAANLPGETGALAQLATTLTTARSGQLFSPEGAAVIRQFLRLIPSLRQLTFPSGLKAALEASGVFHESNLLRASVAGRATNDVVTDLKAILTQLRAQVDARLDRVNAVRTGAADIETLLSLRRELEAGLDGILLNQFRSLPADQATARHWAFSLPLQFQDEFRQLQMQLEREPRAPDAAAEEDRWRLTLQLDLPHLGSIAVAATLVGAQLAVEVVSPRASVRHLLQAQVSLLETALANRGITLVALTGRPPEPESDAAAPTPAAGLDVRA